MVEVILVCSFWCLGLNLLTDYEEPFGFIRVFFDRFMMKKTKFKGEDSLEARKIYYPILYCITCMASLHSILIYSLMMEYTLDSIWQLPLMMVSVAFLNTFLNNLYNYYE